MNEREIFDAAVDIPDTDQQVAFVTNACGEDVEQRERLLELLDARRRLGTFLEVPIHAMPITIEGANAESPGTQIGPYKLLEQIGEGGMGVVYLAEQREPVKRRVALKIIKPGMDSKQVLARFEAERQALAIMDHPNIAKVLDAGATESGRPYFVMELVKGLPITRFCDDNRLDARDRVQLFMSVCHAVQHAHQKGIIHRDLKPSNVLVAMYDDQPVAKIIDFGVAKATNQQLTERTLFTQVGQIVGTWEYMSPEQAVFNQLDVDTRSDVYSLGVILYELLTGVTPLERERLRSSALEEVLRIIREEDPPKPSTRISSLGDAASATAAYRRTSASTLTKSLRGDMDWIIMKSLEKSRARRYQSASSLAADLKHYLDGEPVEARSPSLTYKLQKIASQHRLALTVSAIVLLTLLIGTAGTTWMAMKYRAAMVRYKEILKDLGEELVDRAMADAFSGDLEGAKRSIAKAQEAEAPGNLLCTLEGIALDLGGDNKEAIKSLEQAVQEYPNDRLPLAALRFVRRAESEEYLLQAHLAELPDQPQSEIERDYEKLLVCLSRDVRGERDDLMKVVHDLDELIMDHRRWGMAYLSRARAWMELGMESRDLGDFRKAIADIESAQTLLSAGDELDYTSIYVLTTALECAQDQASKADLDDWGRIAKEIADRRQGKQSFALGHYFHAIGQDEQADKLDAEFLRASQSAREDFNFLSAAALFGVGSPGVVQLMRDAQARAKSAMVRADFECTLGVILVAESASGREEAMKIFQDLRSRDLPGAYYLSLLEIPLLAGHHDVARNAANEFLKSTRTENEWRWFKYPVQYYAGLLSDEELLRKAGPFGNAQCMAHFSIGMKSLALGEREKAKEHFRRTIATRQIGWYNCNLAKGYLMRMEQNPNWPDWIQARLVEEQRK